MDSLDLVSHSPEQTQQLGELLGELARPGDIILLVGALGTGKTCMVQGIARGLGVTEYAFSPSFVIAREYHGRLPLYHVDLYRLEHVGELAELGLEEQLEGNGVCVVEWPEKGMPVLPPDRMIIALEYHTAGEEKRRISLTGEGERHRGLLEQLASVLEGTQWSS